MYLRPLLLCFLLSSLVLLSRAQTTAVVAYYLNSGTNTVQQFDLESGALVGSPCVSTDDFLTSVTYLQNGNIAVAYQILPDDFGAVQTLKPGSCTPIDECREMGMNGPNTNMNIDPITGTMYGTIDDSVSVNSFTSMCEGTPICSRVVTGPPTVAPTVVIGPLSYMGYGGMIVRSRLAENPPDECPTFGSGIATSCTNIKGMAVYDSTHILVVCGSEEMGESCMYNTTSASLTASGFAQIPTPDDIVGLSITPCKPYYCFYTCVLTHFLISILTCCFSRSQIDSDMRRALLSGSSGYGGGIMTT